MATSFGAAAGAYDVGRPTYPADAVAWLFEGTDAPIVDIVDVGAGTGKLTRALLGEGRRLTAIDPDPEMLAVLAAASPDVVTAVGTAESLPLADDSADLVTLGQAWHWVDPLAGSAEIGRVLRPGGTLGLVWNIRDESVPWVAAMSEVMHHSAAEQMIRTDAVTVAAPFGPLEERTWAWTRSITRAALLDMVASRSYVITADATTRARIDADLAELFAGLPELADGGTIDLPYTTHIFRAASPGGHSTRRTIDNGHYRLQS